MGILKDYKLLLEELNQTIKQRNKLLEAIRQIQILNAGKDCDIKWLCEQAITNAK